MLLRKIFAEVVREEFAKLSSLTEPPIKGIGNAATFFGVSKSVMQKLKNDGIIPYVQCGRVVLFNRYDV